MYNYIEGALVEKNPAYVVIDCNGIGYILHISLFTFSKLKEEKHFRLYTHFAIKNEATTPVGFIFFGFADIQERQLFRQLISVSGVGHSTAMLMLSSLTPARLMQAIINGDVAALQSVKGIGGKSAQRIVIDLKDKLDKGKLPEEILIAEHNTNKEEALSGLTVLGFHKTVAEKALKKITDQKGADMPVEELIKEALKIL
jgi:Holliday junction DNA helicase RuvA